MKSFIYICFIVCIACLVHTTAVFARELYGAADDASWAILSTQLSDILGQGKQALYDNHIEDCTKSELGEHCFEDDEWRMVMNRDQPPSVYNYTHTGYQKNRVPPELFELIRAFWERNKNRLEPEYHQEVNTYHNMWDSAPDIIKLGDVRNDGGGLSLKQKITDLARLVLEDWTGQKLRAVSLYGIRVYHNNSLLAPHVDRLPLVTSAIINVDQEVDEPWPLEVYGHDGTATNVTMEPGDMVLYESHSVIHGRPFPLKGGFYANVFIHFEPLGALDDEIRYDEKIPPYLIPNSKWEETWWRHNPDGWNPMDERLKIFRAAATSGDADALEAAVKSYPEGLDEEDQNGWLPLHEAVRAGQLGTVKVILKHGGDINNETFARQTPLNIARKFLGDDHEVTKFLEKNGAVDLSPEYL